jgi:hypothetical protein
LVAWGKVYSVDFVSSEWRVAIVAPGSWILGAGYGYYVWKSSIIWS